MRELPRWLYQPYKFLAFIPFLIASTVVFGLTAMLVAAVAGPRAGSRLGGVLWARLNSYFTPMWVQVEGRQNIHPERSYVIVANHQSHYDIFVLYGWLGVDFKWVMKKELRKVPILGVACEKLGHIYIDRSDTQAAIASLQEAKKKIANGTSALFFPEGTRSLSGELLKFKKGAFQMAMDLGLPILPVTITGTREVLPPRTMDLFPGRVKMQIHPALEPSVYKSGNLEDLMARTRAVIQAGLDRRQPGACRTGIAGSPLA
ncbi:MAG: 1-acylglycerol-3-phosphate O-acyltransferase [bacterium]